MIRLLTPVRTLAITLAATALAISTIAPAQGHSELKSSSPADGTVLSVAPATVSFTFDDDLLPGTDTISVNDEVGNVIATASVEPEAATISMPWPAEAAAGTFQVAYRVVSGDGHPISGAISVTITAEGATPTAEPSSTPSTSVQSDEPAPESRGAAAWLVIVIALLVLALAIIAGVALIRRRHL